MINPDPALGVVDLDIGVQLERNGEAYFFPIDIGLDNIPSGNA